MTRINGNDGNTPDLKGMQAYFEAIKAKALGKADKTDEVTNNSPVSAQTFDFGIGSKNKSQQIAGIEVEGLSKIPETDAVQLVELYAMADIKGIVPTQHVYERIGASVAQVGTYMTNMQTENNAEMLFNSPEFKALDDIFFG